jgi:hypothetical protein
MVTAVSLVSAADFTSIETLPPVENRENPVFFLVLLVK